MIGTLGLMNTYATPPTAAMARSLTTILPNWEMAAGAGVLLQPGSRSAA